MKLVKNLVSIMLAGMMVFSFAACSKSEKSGSSKSSKKGGSNKVEFTEKEFIDALEDAFDTDVEESFIVEENGIAPYNGESYPVNIRYTSSSLRAGTFIVFYEFKDADDADAYFAARLETMKQMDDDYYESSYKSGESGYYCAPKQSVWELDGVYYCDDRVLEITVVMDTEREKAVDLLDALDLPHT